MAHTKRVSLALGLAAATTVGSVLPAHADNAEAQKINASDINAVLTTETTEVQVDPLFAVPTIAERVDGVAAETPVTENTLSTEAAEEEVPFQSAAVDANTSADILLESQANAFDPNFLAFDLAGIDGALESSEVDTLDADLLAQSTRRAYQGVAPVYIGVGGNLGFGNRDDSGISSMGFAVISKVALGPRFSLRPSAIITNQSTSFTIPLTYNFNVTEVGGVRLQPYVGAGVDIPTGADVAFLVDAGLDVPISRDFTINATTNWRLFNGFGFGLTVGVGYNFPFIFE